MRTITIFGGSGFVGRYLVQKFAQNGDLIRVAVRNPVAARFLQPLGEVGQIMPLQTSPCHPMRSLVPLKDRMSLLTLWEFYMRKGDKPLKPFMSKEPQELQRKLENWAYQLSSTCQP
jgi:hypothetical protein